MRDEMIYVVYALGAVTYWMWEYERGSAMRGQQWAQSALWPVFTIERVVREVWWRVRNRAEAIVIEETMGDYMEQTGTKYEPLPWDHPDSDPIGDIRRAMEGVRDQVEFKWDDEAEYTELPKTPRMSLEQLRERALGPTVEVEDEDGGITFR